MILLLRSKSLCDRPWLSHGLLVCLLSRSRCIHQPFLVFRQMRAALVPCIRRSFHQVVGAVLHLSHLLSDHAATSFISEGPQQTCTGNPDANTHPKNQPSSRSHL